MTHRSFRLIPCMAAGALCVAALGASPQTSDEFARRQYESGLEFLQSQKYTEALKDFQAVIDSYPASPVAGDALLEIAKYQLDVAHDLTAAGGAADQLLKKYPSGAAAPMAHVLTGRIALAKGHAPADIDAALASFERVPRLFPGTEAVPAAMYYAGEALRIGRRPADAIERFEQVAREYPESPWAARASLGAGRSLALVDQPAKAMVEMQRVRGRFAGSPEAARALAWNTILYRLFVRQPAYSFSGKTLGTKLKDVEALALDPRGVLFVAAKPTLMTFDASGQARPASPPNTRAIMFDRGAPVALAGGALVGANGAIALAVPPGKPSDKPRPLEDTPGAVVLSLGDRLIADRHGKAIQRFSSAGKYMGVFAQGEADRLAVTDVDDVAALSRGEKTIAIYTPDGKPAVRIAFRGEGYQLQDPVDIAFDPLDHLYVLDRDRSQVLVFTLRGALIATIGAGAKSGGMSRPTAFAVDPSGRLYVADEKAQQILVYQ